VLRHEPERPPAGHVVLDDQHTVAADRREILEHAATDDPVEAGLLREESSELVQLALATLSAQTRCAVVLVCLNGYSYVSAASLMQVKQDRVTYLVRKGREQLRLALAGT
jgi:DNA-directed RNA polymerase specialized sigma24 family protein